MSTTDNASTIKAFFNAFNERDFDRAAALVTEDFELVDYAFGLDFHGPAGLVQWFQGFVIAGPDVRAQLIRTISEGEWVASEHIGRFTQTGPLVTPAGEIPPTGRKVEIQFGETYQVKGGKIASLHAYYDGATIMRQLGLMS